MVAGLIFLLQYFLRLVQIKNEYTDRKQYTNIENAKREGFMRYKIMKIVTLVLAVTWCITACNGTVSETSESSSEDNQQINKNNQTSYKLTMKDEDWLYEPLKSSYKAGEEVVVKIGIVTDTGYFLLVNGEKVEEDAWESDRDWWQFTFTMPEKDVVLEFKTYNGFLQYKEEALLIETYWLLNCEADYVFIRNYYGAYESGAIVAMIDAGDYTCATWIEMIDNYDIQYNDGNRIIVLYDGAFYTLTEAYEKGYLSEADIVDIRDKHQKKYSYLYSIDEG